MNQMMLKSIRNGRAVIFLLAAAFVICPALAVGQEPPAPKDPGGQVAPAGAGESPDEILNRIGETLKKVEELLSKVALGTEAARAQQAVVEDLERLLEDTGKQQQQVIEDLASLVRFAKKECKSGCLSGQQLSQKPKSEEQKEMERQKSQQDPRNSDAGQPDSPQDSKDRQRANVKPRSPKPEKSWNKDTVGQWGLLPIAIINYIFQGDPSKFPPQYREMLEEYYKRLSDSDK